MFIIHILMNMNARKVAQSTAEAFAAFYELFLPKIFRYISYRVTDRHTAEDLTATVFEKALSKFNQYSSEKAALSTWIFRIARNTLIDHIRVKSREKTVPLYEALNRPVNGKSPEQMVIEKEESQILRLCISKLSSHEQEIISLKFSSEMTNRQIADLLGLTESNVGVILYRTVRKLRALYEGWRNG